MSVFHLMSQTDFKLNVTQPELAMSPTRTAPLPGPLPLCLALSLLKSENGSYP